MKYSITTEQINAVLTTVYQTDIPAKTMDTLKKFLSELPVIEETKEEVSEEK